MINNKAYDYMLTMYIKEALLVKNYNIDTTLKQLKDRFKEEDIIHKYNDVKELIRTKQNI